MDVPFLPGEKWVLEVPDLTSPCICRLWGNRTLQLPSPVPSTHAGYPGFVSVYLSLHTELQEDGVPEHLTTIPSPRP